ncbi:Uncharacterised protein [Mycobacteroides abscessus subsp. abscessus]|uniref:hypothetical protein n=1 Tax=Mycobacteroides abscessus TaxID=36809 RepID=UPI00092BDF95|nr:hypothetical protein [Mycobacteroides abscessus]SIL99747.1 Uncharacterised protein [Mycobacteroides abscessus subsp. abscessus]SLC79123.1 Uncharacterised protein [Mycobacteroides abscessus subsp. abscessus]
MSETDWKTVEVAALAPGAAHEMAYRDRAAIHRWYWCDDAMAASDARDGGGDLYEFAPIALLRQERTLPVGAEDARSRVVPGKLTLLGTVIPLDAEEPNGRPNNHDEQLWEIIAVAQLPDGIHSLSVTRGLGSRMNSLLLQAYPDSELTRVKLGNYDLGSIRPVSNYTNGFDLGPWAIERED